MLEPRPVTIFIIDDSPVNLRILSKLLAQPGWQVFSATNGQEGIAEIQNILPDAILLDILMPGMDGFEICRQLKSHPKTQDIPIIFISTLTDTESTLHGLELGAVDYINKTCDFPEIISRLKLHLKLHQTNQILIQKNQELEDQIKANESIRQSLIQSERNFSIAFDYSPDCILIYDYCDETILHINQRFCQLVDLPRESIIGLNLGALNLWVNPQQYQPIQEFCQLPSFAQNPNQAHFQNWEVEVYDNQRNIRTALVSGECVLFNDRQCLLLVMRDITERKAMEQQVKILSQACEQSSASIVITDYKGNIRYINPKFEEVSGYSLAEVINQNPRILKSGDKTPEDYRKMWKTLSSGKEWRGEFHNRRKNGELYWERASISPIFNSDGKITHYVAVKDDITLEKSQAEALYHQAHYDNLTGLPNRSLVKDRLQQAIESGIRDQHLVGVMFIDLDNFKTVNDTLGHDAGDELLKEVAERLQRALRQADTVARLGGDEFLVVISKLTFPRKLTAIAQRLLGVLRQPIYLKGHEVFVYGSIGISVFPDDGLQADVLLQNADTAMFAAKSAGRNLFRFFTPHMNEAAQRRMAMESGLRQGLNHREFTLCYQPCVALDSGTIVGAEALLRWQSPTLGEVPPEQFLPVAEEIGIIVELGEWLLNQVCQQGAHWQMRHLMRTTLDPSLDSHPFWLALNISPRQLRDHYFLNIVQSLINHYQLPPKTLVLEVTERLMQENSVDLRTNLEVLSTHQIPLALDDFGTGYGSLNYLRQCRFSFLKIDRCFVAPLLEDPDTMGLLKAIIAMAHHLNLKVVAEGVETQAQYDFLRAQGCDYAQGYFFSPAIAPADFETLWQAQPFRQLAAK